MDCVRWGMIGCGDVAEVKSGPGFQKARGSTLAAVMRRDRAKAEDFARRHRVPRVHGHTGDLIADPGIDAVYIATPPSTHCELALAVAAAAKPCLVEKPMAVDYDECLRMIEAFRECRRPLWVAYYRRALPRFLLVRELLRKGAIGRLTSIQVEVYDRLVTGARATAWRFNPAAAGAGLFMDVGSHSLDLIDFLVAPISQVSGFAVNTGGAYDAEDVTTATFMVEARIPGTGVWNFNADTAREGIRLTGSEGSLVTPIFADGDVVVSRGGRDEVHAVRNPPHVHQPLIQTIVDELQGRGQCESTGESGARTSWVMDQCVATYYAAAVRQKQEKGRRGAGD